jgi:hypothetical protein
MTDWNPNDPDATRVHYDLSSWSIDDQAELAAELADAEIPHTWDGVELVIPEEYEAAAEEIMNRLEAELGIDSGAGFDLDGDGTDDTFEELPAAIALSATEGVTEFDLAEWADDERSQATAALVTSRVAHRWEGTTLVVATDDEAVAEALLDDVEDGEFVDLSAGAGATPVDPDVDPNATLTAMFLAAERLRKNPLDPDGLDSLAQALNDADPDAAPFGVTPRVWERAYDLADQLADAITDEAGHDHDVVVDLATQLHDHLRDTV